MAADYSGSVLAVLRDGQRTSRQIWREIRTQKLPGRHLSYEQILNVLEEMTTAGTLLSELVVCPDSFPRIHWRIAPSTSPLP